MRQATIRFRLITAHGITGIGDGLWFTLWALYLTTIQDMPVATMGLAMGIGSVLGLSTATPLGALADRYGARGVLVLLQTGRALAVVGFLWVNTFVSLLLAAALLVATQSASAGVRTTVVYKLVDADMRLRVLAQSRVVQHIAYAGGAGLGALVLAADTRFAYQAAIAVTALALLVSGAIARQVPPVVAVPIDRRAGMATALRDLPFLGVMLASAPLTLCWAMLSTGIPVWVHDNTTAPLWTSAFAVVISSLAIAFLQVRFSEAVRTTVNAVRATRWSGLALALACLLFAAGAWPTQPALAFVVLTAGVLFHAVGELYFVAARWSLSLRLMATDAEGQYQGLAATTEAAVSAIGPAVITSLLVWGAATGWILIGVLVLGPVLPMTALVRAALRSRSGHRHASDVLAN